MTNIMLHMQYYMKVIFGHKQLIINVKFLLSPFTPPPLPPILSGLEISIYSSSLSRRVYLFFEGASFLKVDSGGVVAFSFLGTAVPPDLSSICKKDIFILKSTHPHLQAITNFTRIDFDILFLFLHKYAYKRRE